VAVNGDGSRSRERADKIAAPRRTSINHTAGDHPLAEIARDNVLASVLARIPYHANPERLERGVATPKQRPASCSIEPRDYSISVIGDGSSERRKTTDVDPREDVDRRAWDAVSPRLEADGAETDGDAAG